MSLQKLALGNDRPRRISPADLGSLLESSVCLFVRRSRSDFRCLFPLWKTLSRDFRPGTKDIPSPLLLYSRQAPRAEMSYPPSRAARLRYRGGETEYFWRRSRNLRRVRSARGARPQRRLYRYRSLKCPRSVSAARLPAATSIAGRPSQGQTALEGSKTETGTSEKAENKAAFLILLYPPATLSSDRLIVW